MRKLTCLLLAVLTILLCAACGETGPDLPKQITIEKSQAADGVLLCTLVDPEQELRDCLLMDYEEKDAVPLPENASPLYIYTVYQTETRKAGQRTEDLQLVPILRYTVYSNFDLLTEEILPDAVNGLPFMEDLLQCTFQVSKETADFLREYE